MPAPAVYVQPSRVAADGDRDGIPNVLLEAMAMGLPVVATRVSGIPELVQHRRNGLLVEPDDPAALADAIATLIEQPALGDAVGPGRAPHGHRELRQRPQPACAPSTAGGHPCPHRCLRRRLTCGRRVSPT
jgi:glycosyltransferase involved in cell wall biosynthesis